MACHYHSAPSRPAVPLHLQHHTDRQTHTHTHPAPCVDSHILYSSTHVECVLSNSQPDEWEGKTERKTESGWWGGVGGLKVKETERENLESWVYIHAATTHLLDYMNMYICIYVWVWVLRAVCVIETLCGCSSLAGVWGCTTPHNLIRVFTFFTNRFFFRVSPVHCRTCGG